MSSTKKTPESTSAQAPATEPTTAADSTLEQRPTAAARINYAPHDDPPTHARKSVFLAGSTDQNLAVYWQAAVTAHLPISIYNPRRPDWVATWVQDIVFAPFRAQVEWELAMMERVDVIVACFTASSKSPVTLLELGLFAHTVRMVVLCPQGFWRRENVQIVCARYGLKMVDSMEELVDEVGRRLAVSKESAVQQI